MGSARATLEYKSEQGGDWGQGWPLQPYLRNGYQGDFFVCVITAAAFCSNNLESELELSKRDKEIQRQSPSDPLLLLDANQTNKQKAIRHTVSRNYYILFSS